MEVINKLKEISKDCKYTIWYCNIIINGINRQEDIIGEKHHIIPRSLWKEGIKIKENIVKLTYKEHFICHKLLPMMLKNEEDINKMVFALTRMSRINVKNNTNIVGANEFKRIKEDFLEVNRQKALKEMQDDETKERFVRGGQEAGKKIRDEDVFAWTNNSFNNPISMHKKRVKSKSEENRKKCSERELSKPKEDRIKLAKMGQQALVEKLGGDIAYRKYLSERIKGRKKYINPITKEKRMLREAIEGYILITEYNKIKQIYGVYI